MSGWYSKFSHNGKEHVEALGTDDRKKAMAAHREKVKLLGAADLSLTEFQSRSQKRKVTITRLLDDYLTDCETRKLKGLAQIRSHAATVRALWGECPAATVDAPTVAKQIKKWQGDEVADATINRRTQVLHAALTLGRRNKLVVGDVPEFTRFPEAGNARQGFFTPAQVTKLVKHAPDYLADLIEFTALVGWRPKSSKALTWADVNLKEKTLTIGTSKNGKPQVLPIAGPLVDLFKVPDHRHGGQGGRTQDPRSVRLDPALRTSAPADVLTGAFARLEPKPERNRRVDPTRLDPPIATP